jgi:hypothetical protein
MARLLIVIALLLPSLPAVAGQASVASVRPPHHERFTLKMRRHTRNREILRAKAATAADAPRSAEARTAGD